MALLSHRRVVELHQGDFLPGNDDPDVVHERYRLQSLAYDAACRVTELLVSKGEPDAALEHALAARRIDSIAQRAPRLEIRCHLALGSISAALAVADHLRAMLADERMTPDRETEMLLARLAPPA